MRQNRDNIEALRLKQLANQEIEKSRDFESMEKYRQMGLSEDEAKIHLKREKRAEKVEKERRLQIEAEAGFQNRHFSIFHSDVGDNPICITCHQHPTKNFIFLQTAPPHELENPSRIKERLKFFRKL